MSPTRTKRGSARIVHAVEAVMPRFPKPEASPSANALAGDRGLRPGESSAVDRQLSYRAQGYGDAGQLLRPLTPVL